MKPQEIIISPLVTEKSIADQELGRYSFIVDPNANKPQISKAFSSIFNTKVLSVRTHRLHAKPKMDWRKRLQIKTSNRKIAVITVNKDQKIEILSLKAK